MSQIGVAKVQPLAQPGTAAKDEPKTTEDRLTALKQGLATVQKSLTEMQALVNKEVASNPVQKKRILNELVDEKDANGKTKLFRAVEERNIKRVSRLLKEGANVNLGNGYRTPLHEAASRGFDDVCALLLLANADVNVLDLSIRRIRYCITNINRTPLHLASIDGHLRVVELLLQFGAVFNRKDCDGRTAYYYAVERKDTEIANLLKAVAVLRTV